MTSAMKSSVWSDLSEQILCRIFRSITVDHTIIYHSSKLGLRHVCQSWRSAVLSPSSWHDMEEQHALRYQCAVCYKSQDLKRRLVAGGLETLESLKLELTHGHGDWDSVFWQICKCKALKSLHIVYTGVFSQELLQWLAWGPTNLQALQQLTLQTESCETDDYLFGIVTMPPKCDLHIHMYIRLTTVTCYNVGGLDVVSELECDDEDVGLPPFR